VSISDPPKVQGEKCPRCGADLYWGYDEDGGGNVFADGSKYCSRCSYFSDKEGDLNEL